MEQQSQRNKRADRKRSVGRAKKRPRRFGGSSQRPTASRSSSSASEREVSADYRATNHAGYRLFDVQILFKALQTHLCCKECGGSITMSEVSSKGLGGVYGICCENCIRMKTFTSSPIVHKNAQAYDINRRSVLAMRCIGRGLESLEKFCGVMDLPPPVKRFSYNSIVKHMVAATSAVAESVFRQAVEEEVEASGTPGDRQITVSCDGTWQKRGFKSLNGICTVIGTETGKVVDLEVLSSHCNACIRWKGKQTGEDWLRWYEQHKPYCQANHTGSAGAMEVNGMVRIFQRSEEKYDAKYIGYIGDGDTKSDASVSKAEPYGPDIKVTKIECCGHAEKRFGTAARMLKIRMKGQKLSDGKILGGKGRLTDVAIDQMQTYYGKAIRSNSTSVDEMSRAIWAIWYHRCSTDASPQHHMCPSGEDSWCKYNKSIATGTVDQYRHKNFLPMPVMEAIKPVFERLTEKNLLTRCLGGKAQNANESLNNIIWKLCPKRSYSGRSIVQVAANIAAINFSEGATGILDVMSELKVTPGVNARDFTKRLDEHRVYQSQKQAALNSIGSSHRLPQATTG